MHKKLLLEPNLKRNVFGRSNFFTEKNIRHRQQNREKTKASSPNFHFFKWHRKRFSEFVTRIMIVALFQISVSQPFLLRGTLLWNTKFCGTPTNMGGTPLLNCLWVYGNFLFLTSTFLLYDCFNSTDEYCNSLPSICASENWTNL